MVARGEGGMVFFLERSQGKGDTGDHPRIFPYPDYFVKLHYRPSTDNPIVTRIIEACPVQYIQMKVSI